MFIDYTPEEKRLAQDLRAYLASQGRKVAA